jgi:hypothetical protein
MFRATLICPDAACAAVYDAVGSLEEIQLIACECGCTLQIDMLAETDAAPTAGSAFALVALS